MSMDEFRNREERELWERIVVTMAGAWSCTEIKTALKWADDIISAYRLRRSVTDRDQ